MKKKLYLLRHADAAPRRTGQHDADRPLTLQGRKQAAAAAAGAKAKAFSFDIILTSPYARARETARIFAELYEMLDRVIEEPLLASGCSIKEIRVLLDRHARHERILFVGHEPDLGEIAAHFLGLAYPQPFDKAEYLEIEISQQSI